MNKQKRIHFTQKRIDALALPEKGEALYYDDEERGLTLRVYASGRKVFYFSKRVGQKRRNERIGTWPDMNVPRAREIAKQKNKQVEKDREAAVHGMTGGGDVSIEDAFQTTLEAATRSAASAKDWGYSVAYFRRWLTENFPQVKNWIQLNRQVLDRYQASIKDKSPNRRRLLLQPIRQTARRMEALFDVRDCTKALVLSNKTLNPPPAVHLADVLRFLDWCRDYAPELEAGVALQGLAALRPSEAVRLRWSRVDMKRGAVEISGQTKNEYSRRVIPIPARAVEALRRSGKIRPEGKVRDADPHVILSGKGFDYDGGSRFNWSKATNAAIRDWCRHETDMRIDADGEDATPYAVQWKGKDLRNVVPQFCERRGIGGMVLEAYIGHAARGVTAQNYVGRLAAATYGEVEALDESLAMFRRLILEPFEAEIERLSGGEQGEAKVITAAAPQ